MKQIWMTAMLAIVMVAGEAESGVGSWLGKTGKAMVRVCTRGSRKVLGEGTEMVVRKACPKLADDAVKLAGKYGDDMVRVLSKYGDDAARLMANHGDGVAKALIKHGDDVMRVAGKYGDDGVRCLAREGDAAVQLIRQHGDEVLEVLMQHEGIGKELIAVYGREGVRIGGKVTDEGAAVLVRYGRKLSSAKVREIAEEIAKTPQKLGGKDVLEIILRKAPHIGVFIAVMMVADSVRGVVNEVTKKMEKSSGFSLYAGLAGLTGIVAGAWLLKGVGVAWVRERRKHQRTREEMEMSEKGAGTRSYSSVKR